MPWDFHKVGKTNLYGDCRLVFGQRLSKYAVSLAQSYSITSDFGIKLQQLNHHVILDAGYFGSFQQTFLSISPSSTAMFLTILSEKMTPFYITTPHCLRYHFLVSVLISVLPILIFSSNIL